MSRAIPAFFALLCLCHPAAAAGPTAAPAAGQGCAGQTGKVIFEDNFADDSGGWSGLGNEYLAVKDGTLILSPSPKGAAEDNPTISSVNPMFSAGEGDYCVEYVVPKSPDANNFFAGGLLFWRLDKENEFLAQTFSNGKFGVYRLEGNKWTTIFEQVVDGVKSGPDETNALRVIAKPDKLTFFVNGNQVKALRAQMPSGTLRFGVYAQVDKSTDVKPVLKVKYFKVTAGQ